MTTPLVRKVRVTELGVYARCPRQWHYKYEEGWRLKDSYNPYLISGTAIHHGIEASLALGKDPVAEGLAELERIGGPDWQRFEAGVVRAVGGLPEWVYTKPHPMVEQQMEVDYGTVIVTGKPDLWFVDGQTIEIWDWKSTSKDEENRLADYERWNEQPRFYAVLLHDWLKAQGREPPQFFIGHMVLSTRGKHVYGTPSYMSTELLTRARIRMVELADRVGQGIYMISNPFNCGSCEFNAACEGELTGDDPVAILEDKYEQVGGSNATIAKGA